MPGGEVTNVLSENTDDLNRAVSRLAMLQSDIIEVLVSAFQDY